MIFKLYKDEKESYYILYNEDSFEIPKDLTEALKLELVNDNISVLDNILTPIYRYDQFCLTAYTGKRNRERKLSEVGINNWKNISDAYDLLRNKALKQPKEIRDFVFEKYTELLYNIYPKKHD